MAASDFMTQCGRVHVTLAAKNDEKGSARRSTPILTIRLLFAKLIPESPAACSVRMLGRILEWKERPEMALTKRQRQIYDFIADFVRENGYSPSFEEIGAGLGLSSLATVHKHINNLEAKKLLRRDYNRSRSIDVLPLPPELRPSPPAAGALGTPLPGGARPFSPDAFELPLLGRIAAGRPIEQTETPETISLTDFTRAKNVFVLQVMGESMQDEHIVNGDYVLVEKTEDARDGEIVVALVNGSETTLKRLYRAGSQVRLQPSNAAMQPIVVPAEAVQVQGRVVAVLRKY